MITSSPDKPDESALIRFASQVRSDQLAELARLLSHIEPFRSSTTVVQVAVILDANVIIADLIWLCGRRKKVEARSALLELLECATVKAYAPTYLAHEVENHFMNLHNERGIDPEQARREWNRFVPLITFIDVGGPDASFVGVTDPKDVPYVRLQKRLAVPVVSSDPDLAMMGANVIQIQVFAPLQSYSRQRAVEYQIKVVGVGAILAAGVAARMALDGTRAASRAIASLPKPILALGAVGLIATLVHPTSRRWVLEQLERTVDVAGAAAGGLFEAMLAAGDEHNQAKQSADECLATVTALLTDAGMVPSEALRTSDTPVGAKPRGKGSTRTKRVRKPSQSSDSSVAATNEGKPESSQTRKASGAHTNGRRGTRRSSAR